MFTIDSISLGKATTRIQGLLAKIVDDFHTIFTPLELCLEIAQKLILGNAFHSQSRTLVIANLEFLYVIVRLYRSQGWSLENVYFAACSDVKLDEARSVLVAQNVHKYTYGSLEESFEKMPKFDVIVGNPPYQYENTGSNKTLFDEFYYLATNLTSKHLIFIAPTMWLTSSKKSLVELRTFLHKHGLCAVDELNSQKTFGVIVNMLGITYQDVTKSPTSYAFTKLTGETIHCPSDGSAPLLTNDPLTKSILEKLSSGQLKLNACNSQLRGLSKEGTCSNGEACKIRTKEHIHKMINKVNGGNIEYAYTKVNKNIHQGMVRVMFGDLSSRDSLGVVSVVENVEYTTSRSVVYVPVDSFFQGRSLKSFLDSKVFRFVLPLRRPGTNNAIGILRQISHPPLDRDWTNEELYEHFDLREEEIKLIEETVK